jgi:hypothetical protein
MATYSMANLSVVIIVVAGREGICYNRCCGDIAQSGERCPRMAEVGGSNPPISTTYPSKDPFSLFDFSSAKRIFFSY